MAKTRSDIELVISAEDNAKTTLEQFQELVLKLSEAQKKFSKSMDGSGESSDKLKSNIASLNQVLNELGSRNKAVQAFRKQREEVRAASKEFFNAKNALQSTNKQYADAEKAVNNYRVKLGKLEEQQKQLNTKLGAVKAYGEISKELVGVTKYLNTTKDALARTEKQVIDAAASVGKLRIKLSDLKGQKVSLGEQSKSIESYQKLSTALEKIREKQVKAQEAFDKTNKKIKASAKPSATLQKQFDNQSARLAKYSDQFEALVPAVDKAGAKLREYGVDLSNISEAQEKIAASQGKVANEINKTSTALSAATKSSSELVKIQKKQSTAVDETQQSFNKLFTAAKDTKKELGGYGIAVKNLGDTQKTLADQQTRTSKSINDTKNALNKANVAEKALAKTQKEQEKNLAKRESNFRRLLGYFKQSATALKGYGVEVRNLDAEEKRLASTQAKVTEAINKQTVALENVAVSSKTAGTAIRKTGENSRRSLSYFQRLRGEMLSLIATFGGLYAAGRGVSEVFETQRQLDAAKARLGVAFEGDDAAIDSELKRVRQEADRLGLSFQTLLEEYTKFVPASKRMGLTLEESRQIFDGVSEAAVVNRLSIDDLSGVYKALGQIISKNRAQAEEIRGQLGDRLVGTVIDYAAALGVSTERFSEMLEQGEVAADSLVQFSGQLKKVYGSELADAVNQPVASLARLGNSIDDIKIQIAQSGFVDTLGEAFADIAKELSDPKTREGARQLGRILGDITKAVVFLIQNLDVLKNVLITIFSIKIAGKIVGIGSSALQAAKGVNTLKGALGFLASRGAVATGIGGVIALIVGALVSLGIKAATAGDEMDILRDKIYGLTGAAENVRRSELEGVLSETESKIQAFSREADAIEARLSRAEKRLKENRSADFDEFGYKEPDPIRSEKGRDAESARLAKIKKDLVELKKFREDAENEIAAIDASLNDAGDDSVAPYVGRLSADAEREYQKLTKEFDKLNEASAKRNADSLNDRFDIVEEAYQDRIKRISELEKTLQDRLAKLIEIKPSIENKGALKVLELDIERMNKMLASLDVGRSDAYAASLSERAKIQQDFNKKRIANELKIADLVNDTQRELAKQEADTLEKRFKFIDQQLDERIARIRALENVSSSKKQVGIGAIEEARGEIKERARLTFIQDSINEKLSIQSQRVELIKLKYIDVAEQNEKIKQIAEETIPSLRELAAQGEALARSLNDESAVLSFQKITAETSDQIAQKKELVELQEQINRTMADQQQRVDVINLSFNDTWEKQKAIKEVNEELNPIIADTARKALELARALGDKEAIRTFELIIAQVERLDKELGIGITSINRLLAGGLTNAIADTVTGIKSAGEAFRQFAADFLRRLGEMILQQTIFNALQTAAASGGKFGSILGFIGAATQHTGGIAGIDGGRRMVPAMAFAGAPRFHGGGIPGVKSDEVPTLLQKDEEVLTTDDPRHRYNGGGNEAPINIVNSFDTESVVSQGIATPSGERAILNVIRANRNVIKGL